MPSKNTCKHRRFNYYLGKEMHSDSHLGGIVLKFRCRGCKTFFHIEEAYNNYPDSVVVNYYSHSYDVMGDSIEGKVEQINKTVKVLMDEWSVD